MQHQCLGRAFTRTQCTLHVAEEVHLRMFSGEEQPVVVRLGELFADSEYLSRVRRPVTGLDEGHVGPVAEKPALLGQIASVSGIEPRQLVLEVLARGRASVAETGPAKTLSTIP